MTTRRGEGWHLGVMSLKTKEGHLVGLTVSFMKFKFTNTGVKTSIPGPRTVTLSGNRVTADDSSQMRSHWRREGL